VPRVVGIDHLVLSVGDFARSKEFYDQLLRFLGFKRKYDYADMASWSNGKTLFWIAAADAKGKTRKYRKGDIGFHHYAFELASRKDVDALGAFLEEHGANVADPPGEYYGRSYYAVYIHRPRRHEARRHGVQAAAEAAAGAEEATSGKAQMSRGERAA
jgi:catechol 2,3-dioxygenase-like lactoylglutathione lyase family enzyme